MADLSDEIETIAAVGGYDDGEAVVDAAIRELLRRRPELRLSVAVEKYRSGAVSVNRGAELGGVSTEEFKSELADRGIEREAGFLEDDRREQLLDEFSSDG